MTLPSAVSKTSVDDGAVDTPAAGRQNIEDAIDALNTIITHLGTSAVTSGTSVLGVGTGLTSSGGNLNVNVGTGIGQIVQLVDKGGSAAMPVADGSNLTGVAAGPRQKVAEYAAGSGVIDVTGFADGTSNWEIVLSNLEVNANGVIRLRVSIDDGATFESTLGDYEYSAVAIASNPTSHQVTDGGNTQDHIGLTSTNVSLTFSSSALGCRGVVTIADARATDRAKTIGYRIGYGISASSVADTRGVGVYKGGNEAIDQVRFLNSAGNITAGKAVLYKLADE